MRGNPLADEIVQLRKTTTLSYQQIADKLNEQYPTRIKQTRGSVAGTIHRDKRSRGETKERTPKSLGNATATPDAA